MHSGPSLQEREACSKPPPCARRGTKCFPLSVLKLPQLAWVGLPFLPSELPLRDKFSSLMVSGDSNRCTCVQPLQQNAAQPPREMDGPRSPLASAKQLLLLQGTSSQKGTHEPRSSASRCINHSFLWSISHRALVL